VAVSMVKFNIIILRDYLRICVASFAETSLCGAWLYVPGGSGMGGKIKRIRYNRRD
jgi:hypothetical protein